MKRFIPKPQKTPEELKTHPASAEDGGSKIAEWTLDQFVGGNLDRQGVTTPKQKAPKMSYMNYRQKKESVLFTSQEIVDFLKENNHDNAWYVNTKMPGAPVAHKFLSPLSVKAHVAEAVKKMRDEDAADFAHKARKSAEAGKKSFTIGGETHPVTVKKMDECGRTDVDGMNDDEADKGPGKGGGFTNKMPLNPVKWPAPAHGGPAKMPKHKDSLEEEEEPPFEGGHKRTQHKDKFGNIIKQKNLARHLARQAMKNVQDKKPMKENNDSHTHAAHFKNSKGEWAGMALIDAKDDEDAVKKAHEISAGDKWKDFQLDSVEKHVPVAEGKMKAHAMENPLQQDDPTMEYMPGGHLHKETPKNLKQREVSSWKTTYAPETEDDQIEKNKNPGKIFKEEQVDEVLKPSMGAAAYIHDFVHSENPKFEGKSKKERIKQALAAYYSAKRGMKEEVEQVDEGSPEFNARASRYAKADAAEKAKEGKYSKKYPGGKEQHAKDTDAFMKRFPVPKNEEVEQVDELKKATLRSYAAKRGNQPDAGGKGANIALALTKAKGKPPFPGMKDAKVHATKEEVEQNESVGTNRSVEMPHSFDVIVHDQNGKEVKVHKGVKALNKKHAETKVKYKHPEAHTCIAHMNEEVISNYEDLSAIIEDSFLNEAKTREQLKAEKEARRAARNARMSGHAAALHHKMSTKLQRRVGAVSGTSAAQAKKATHKPTPGEHPHPATAISAASDAAHPKKWSEMSAAERRAENNKRQQAHYGVTAAYLAQKKGEKKVADPEHLKKLRAGSSAPRAGTEAGYVAQARAGQYVKSAGLGSLYEKKDVNQPDNVELKKVSGGKKESGAPAGSAKKLKRKYLGNKIGRTATGKPANKIITKDPTIDDIKT